MRCFGSARHSSRSFLGKHVRTVNEHLQNIYEEGELPPGPTNRKFRIVRLEGLREVAREIEHCNLEAILAVGYRVRSDRGTQFRKWATERQAAEIRGSPLGRKLQARKQAVKWEWIPLGVGARTDSRTRRQAVVAIETPG